VEILSRLFGPLVDSTNEDEAIEEVKKQMRIFEAELQ
jgi:hypothetical protein